MSTYSLRISSSGSRTEPGPAAISRAQPAGPLPATRGATETPPFGGPPGGGRDAGAGGAGGAGGAAGGAAGARGTPPGAKRRPAPPRRAAGGRGPRGPGRPHQGRAPPASPAPRRG